MRRARADVSGATLRPIPSTRMLDARATLRKTRLRLLTPLLALLFLSTIDRATISLAALQMNAQRGLDAQAYGFGVSIFFVGYILMQWPSLWLLQRIGLRRWVLV